MDVIKVGDIVEYKGKKFKVIDDRGAKYIGVLVVGFDDCQNDYGVLDCYCYGIKRLNTHHIGDKIDKYTVIDIDYKCEGNCDRIIYSCEYKDKYTVFKKIFEQLNLANDFRIDINPMNIDITKTFFTGVHNTKDSYHINCVPPIKKVIFSDPATIVIWEDDTKTIVKAGKNDKGKQEKYDPEKGLAMAICKKLYGTNASGSNYYDVLKKWLEE